MAQIRDSVRAFGDHTADDLVTGQQHPPNISGKYGMRQMDNTKCLRIVSRIVALILFAGFISVPISVLGGWVR
jgi:hypothetical protein